MKSGWMYLAVAGLTEIGWAIGLKLTEGWTRLGPSIVTLVLIVFSYVFLSLALRTLPLGTAYAVWTGIGAAGTAIAGIFLFNEPAGLFRLACLAMIIAGTLGLKTASAG